MESSIDALHASFEASRNNLLMEAANRRAVANQDISDCTSIDKSPSTTAEGKETSLEEQGENYISGTRLDESADIFSQCTNNHKALYESLQKEHHRMREKYTEEIEQQHRRTVDAHAILSKELKKSNAQRLADLTSWTERNASMAETIDDLSSKLRERQSIARYRTWGARIL